MTEKKYSKCFFFVAKSSEKQNLINKLKIQLDRFYESIGHIKQNTQG